jgi:lysophospholipase L1-like esterase
MCNANVVEILRVCGVLAMTRWKQITKAAGAFAIAITLWEAILRHTLESTPGAWVHPQLGKIERKGLSVQGWEGFGRIQLNSLGMRESEITPKAAHEYRILMLGDSFTRADEIPEQQHFIHLAQVSLNQWAEANQAQQRVNIINAGKPGASPANYLYAAEFHRHTFTPDSVVIQLTAHDFTLDLRDESTEFYLQPKGNRFELTRNYQFQSDNRLAKTFTERMPQLQALLQFSILRVSGKQVQRMVSGTETDLVITNQVQAVTEAEIYDNASVADQQLVEWTLEQLDQAFPNLQIVFIPAINYFDVEHHDLKNEHPRNVALEKILAQTAAEKNIPFVSLRSDFIDFYRTHQAELSGFNNTQPGLGHLNAEGHQLVAQQLFQLYRSELSQ